MRNGNTGPNRTLVIPGEIIGEGDLKAGKNTYKRGDKIYASQMGFKTINANFVNVIALSGKYIPKIDDLVVGIIQSVSPTSWLVDINSPYPAPLHVNEVPWRVDFGDTARYLNFGDTILARVFLVDEVKRIQVTMKDQGSRKLSGGQLIEVSPTKVPRVIGKGGSMISLIKQKTMCRLFVGQNGRIWIDGEPENIRIAVNAIRFIERESHRLGLTESVERYLEKVASHKGDDEPILPEIIPQEESVRRSQPVRPRPREGPRDAPKGIVGDTSPIEVPREVPKEVPVRIPTETPVGVPKATPVVIPRDELKKDPIHVPKEAPKVEQETTWAPKKGAGSDAEKAPEPKEVTVNDVAQILSTIPSPATSTFKPPARPSTAPPLRPPVRPPAGPPRPPMDSPMVREGVKAPAELSGEEQKPKEQILKDEEFERMPE